MASVTYQGIVSTTGSTKIICTGLSLTIHNIIITNSTSSYVLTFNRFVYDPIVVSLIPIYELTLDGGDTIIDTEEYVLNNGDYIQLISNVPGTTYSITANAS